MKLSAKPRVILIANPDFCNPYPNPLTGIPAAMEKMGIPFLLMNPATIMFEEFKKQIESYKPEVLFGLIQLKQEVAQFAGYLKQYKPVPAINWNMEDPNGIVSPKDDLNMVDLSASYDLWFGIDKKMVSFWKTRGVYMPQAFDERIYYEQNGPRCYDVSYIGQLGSGKIFEMYWPYMNELARYGKRAMLCIDRPMGVPVMPKPIEKILRSKKNRAFLQNFPFWKCGWKNPPDEHEKAILINQSKIHFGISRLHGDWEKKFKTILPQYPLDKHGQFYQLKSRLFQAVGAGAMALNDYIPELDELFVIGKEIVVFEYGNLLEMREKLAWYLSHDTQRNEIARAGNKRAHRDHTFTARVNQIFAKVRELL